MKKLCSVMLIFLICGGCGIHSAKHPMAGVWYSNIEKIDVRLELVIVEETVTGGLKLLEAAGNDIPKGTVLDIMDGSCSDGELRFCVDIDENGIKSEEDVYMELHLEGKEALVGFGHEVSDPDDVRELSFRRSL